MQVVCTQVGKPQDTQNVDVGALSKKKKKGMQKT